MRGIKLTLIIALVISAFAFAQDAPQTPPTVKHVPIANTPSDSGKQMFASYCAVCHGPAAKGDGPAAAALKTPPPDLTVLAKKNGGKYPSAHVAAVIRGQATLVSHGTAEMPMWGPLFSSISGGHPAQVQQRISNLAQYVGTLQAK
jgi:mono/diheme cytochrome c family protein